MRSKSVVIYVDPHCKIVRISSSTGGYVTNYPSLLSHAVVSVQRGDQGVMIKYIFGCRGLEEGFFCRRCQGHQHRVNNLKVAVAVPRIQWAAGFWVHCIAIQMTMHHASKQSYTESTHCVRRPSKFFSGSLTAREYSAAARLYSQRVVSYPMHRSHNACAV